MLQEARRAMVEEGGSSIGWKSPDLANKTTFADFKREHDAWFEEIAALRSHAPVLWLKSEDFFHAPEEEAQRVFDFLGVERANVSIKRYEDEALNGILRGQKYLNGRRTVAGAPPSAAPPPPPFPPLRPGVTFGVKHTSGFAGRQLQFCRLLESIREVYPEESSPILVAYDGEETYEAGREPCTGVGVTYLNLERRGLSAARNAIVRRVATEFVMVMDDDVEFITGKTRVETLVGHLRADPGLVLAAACHEGEPDGSWANIFSNPCYAHNLTLSGSTVTASAPPATELEEAGLHRSHLTQNVFVGRTATLRALPWDERQASREPR